MERSSSFPTGYRLNMNRICFSKLGQRVISRIFDGLAVILLHAYLRPEVLNVARRMRSKITLAIATFLMLGALERRLHGAVTVHLLVKLKSPLPRCSTFRIGAALSFQFGSKRNAIAKFCRRVRRFDDTDQALCTLA